MPIQYIPKMREVFADQPPYQWTVSEGSPWTPFTTPLAQARIALISSCGVFHKDQEAFNPVRDDLTFREIPKDIALADLRVSHESYDHTDAMQDMNVVLPITRFRELEQEGVIGALHDTVYTFMGRIFRRSTLNTQMTEWLLERLRAAKVDAAFLVPC